MKTTTIAGTVYAIQQMNIFDPYSFRVIKLDDNKLSARQTEYGHVVVVEKFTKQQCKNYLWNLSR